MVRGVTEKDELIRGSVWWANMQLAKVKMFLAQYLTLAGIPLVDFSNRLDQPEMSWDLQSCTKYYTHVYKIKSNRFF